MKIAFFTAGTVGAGHLVLGLAVERGLRRAGFTGEYRMFGPEVPYPLARRVAYQPVAVNYEELTDAARAPESELARALRTYAPDLLLIDLFWAPLNAILPLPSCETWLLLRYVPDAWLVGTPDIRFDSARYPRIVATEPLDHPLLTDLLDPIVIANPDECAPKHALRERVGATAADRLVVITDTAPPGTFLEQLPDDIGSDDTVVRFNLHDVDAPFPLAEWLPGADLVIGAAGYSTFWEARWLGYFDRTRFFPVECKIDNQYWRVRHCSDWVPEGNGADQLAGWIVAGG